MIPTLEEIHEEGFRRRPTGRAAPSTSRGEENDSRRPTHRLIMTTWPESGETLTVTGGRFEVEELTFREELPGAERP